MRQWLPAACPPRIFPPSSQFCLQVSSVLCWSFPHWNASWRQHRLVNCLIQLLLPNPRPISSFCTSWCCRLFLLWKVSPLISAELLWYVVFCLSPSLSMASSTQLLNTSVLSSTFVFLLSTLPLVYLWGVVHIYKFDYDSLVSFLQSMLYTV